MTIHLWSANYGKISPKRHFQLSEEIYMNWACVDQAIKAYTEEEKEGLKYGHEATSDWMLSLPGGLV